MGYGFSPSLCIQSLHLYTSYFGVNIWVHLGCLHILCPTFFWVLLGYSFAGDGHFVLFGLCVSRCFFTHWKVLVNVLNGDGDDDEDEWVFRPMLTRSK
jgi:hypothetical protein